MFENDVKEYGIQTEEMITILAVGFENDVKEYGIQTFCFRIECKSKFENDVKEYGIQTRHDGRTQQSGLRMM